MILAAARAITTAVDNFPFNDMLCPFFDLLTFDRA